MLLPISPAAIFAISTTGFYYEEMVVAYLYPRSIKTILKLEVNNKLIYCCELL